MTFEPSLMGQLHTLAPSRATGYALLETGLPNGERGRRYPASSGDCYKLDPEFFEYPADAPPGLYSIVAIRGFELATLTGGIEVTS